MIIGQRIEFGIGGADRAAQNLIKGLLETPDVDVMVFYNQRSFPGSAHDSPSGLILSRQNQYHCPLIEIHDPSEFLKYRLDILHSHRTGDDLDRTPGFDKLNFPFAAIETNFHGALSTKADFRIFPSLTMLQGRTVSGPFAIIPNPISTPSTHENLRESLGLTNKFVYGRVGRPSSEVFSPVNLTAYAQIETDRTMFLYLAPCYAAIDVAKQLRIKHIKFLPPTIDDIEVSKIYNTFDIVCHSNCLGETFGNTIAEAMMHGKPVISHLGSASCWPQAQKEVLGRDDLYVQTNIIRNYAELMKRLRDDKQYYAEIKAYVIKRSADLYDYRVVTKRYVDVYRQILRSRQWK